VHFAGRKNDSFSRLITQCLQLNIDVLNDLPEFEQYDLMVDAIFGFSFKGPIRENYREVISRMSTSSVPVLAIDLPSGWDVNKGTNFDIILFASLKEPFLQEIFMTLDLFLQQLCR
jgi:NAD(P)H-hydrate repair Nnr-like enzyme with NAD(P)H-hydrate epimerase domain